MVADSLSIKSLHNCLECINTLLVALQIRYDCPSNTCATIFTHNVVDATRHTYNILASVVPTLLNLMESSLSRDILKILTMIQGLRHAALVFSSYHMVLFIFFVSS